MGIVFSPSRVRFQPALPEVKGLSIRARYKGAERTVNPESVKDTQSVNIQLPAGKAIKKGGRRRVIQVAITDQLAKPFIFFSARILTPVLAGLALNQISCLVNGLMPRRALIAGRGMVVTFINPGNVNWP